MSLGHVLQVFHTLLSKDLIHLNHLLILEFCIKSYRIQTLLFLLSLLFLFLLLDSLELSRRFFFILIIGSRNFGQMSNWGCRVSNSFSISLLLLCWLLSLFLLSSFFWLLSGVFLSRIISTCWRLLRLGHRLAECFDEITSLVLRLNFITISWFLAVCALASLVRIDLYELIIISKYLWLLELIKFDCLSCCRLIVWDGESTYQCKHRQYLLRFIAIHKFCWFVKIN